MKRARVLVVNLLTTLFILAAVELMAGWILQKIYNREFDRSLLVSNKYFASSGLKANATGVVWGKKLTTDKYGGRTTAPSHAAKKWLYLGDSVTEGVGVCDSCTFAALIAQGNPDYQFINLSLIGYSTADYLNVLKAVAGSDSTITHVTIFYCLNDVYGTAKTSDLPTMAKQNWKGKLNTLLQDRYATYKLLKLLIYQHSDSYFRYDAAFYTPQDEHFSEAMQQLSACDSICRINHVAMEVVILPYRSQLQHPNKSQPQQLVKAYCFSKGIDFRDALPYLAGQPHPSSLYLFADEIHFSAEGHQLISKWLVK